MSSLAMNVPKYKVFVTQPIPKEAVDIMVSNNLELIINEKTPLKRETLLDSLKNCDALFCTLNEKIDKELLEKCGEKLKVLFFDNMIV